MKQGAFCYAFPLSAKGKLAGSAQAVEKWQGLRNQLFSEKPGNVTSPGFIAAKMRITSAWRAALVGAVHQKDSDLLAER